MFLTMGSASRGARHHRHNVSDPRALEKASVEAKSHFPGRLATTKPKFPEKTGKGRLDLYELFCRFSEGEENSHVLKMFGRDFRAFVRVWHGRCLALTSGNFELEL
jgi:hypothetical protein